MSNTLATDAAADEARRLTAQEAADAAQIATQPISLPASANPLRCAGRALRLDCHIYGALRSDPNALQRGLLTLALVLVVVGGMRVLGVLLNALTTTRIWLLQERLYGFLLESGWYADAAARSTTFPAAFERTYESAWRILLLLGGWPQQSLITTVLLVFFATVALGAVAWFLHGSAAHALARWQGSKASAGRTFGALAVAWSPLLLTAFGALPGVRVPFVLVLLWLLCAQYQAVQETHGLHWARSLAAVALPYLFWFVLALSTLLALGPMVGS